MPVSDNIALPYVSAILVSLRPASALDIGIGMGKFGFILREACEWGRFLENGVSCAAKEDWKSRLDGIEVCSEYITPLQKYLYDKIYIGPAQEIVAELDNYDLIHMGDVIEHLEKSEGQRLLDILFKKARLGVLVVTPVGKCDQEGLKGNPYEEHKSVWSPADLRRFPCVWSRKIAKRQWIMVISRKPHWLRDPIAPRKSEAKLIMINTRRQKLKRTCKRIFGSRGLSVLLKLKRGLEGWKT